MSNSLDPDQDRHFVGPDLDQSCLQRLSAGLSKEIIRIKVKFLPIFLLRVNIRHLSRVNIRSWDCKKQIFKQSTPWLQPLPSKFKYQPTIFIKLKCFL